MQELINTSSSQTVELLLLYRHYITHQACCIDLYSWLSSMLRHFPLNNFKAAWNDNAYQLQFIQTFATWRPTVSQNKKKKNFILLITFSPQYYYSMEHSLACFTLLSINPFSVPLHSALALVSMSFLTTLH